MVYIIYDIDLHSAMFENGDRFREDWDCARNLLIVLMRKYFWRVDGDRIVVVEYVIDDTTEVLALPKPRSPHYGILIFGE